MFDGDEMNAHMAQSVQARNELKRIANVKYQIIGSKDSNPIIGCVQDALSGCYLLTKLNTKIIGSEVSNFLCCTTSETKFDIIKDKYYNGQEIFSHIIPNGINNTVIKNGKKEIEIIDGQLLNGVLNKKTLSTVKNSIIHFIWDKFGPDKTRRFIDDVQRLALSYLNYRGFTIGYKDCLIDKKLDDQIQLLIDQKILEYEVALTQYENDIEQFNPELIEYKLYQSLNSFGPDIGNILLKSLDPQNNFFVCIDSGSKGNVMNITQIMGCIGQKSVEGNRIKKKVENRSLSIFHKDDDSPKALGFIRNSYTTGLTDYEYFWDAITSREGLISTAIKSVTWETPIIIIENGKYKYIEIGRWIDTLLELNEKDIEHHEERHLELLNVNNIYIPTTDYYGKVSWGNVVAVTRHDPGDQLYEIVTSGGRRVTVTESKSLLIWNKETKQFKEMLTPEIKLGDYVPVTMNLCDPPISVNYIEYKNHKIEMNYINGQIIGTYLITKELPDIYEQWFIDYLKSLDNNLPAETFIGPDIFIKSILNSLYKYTNIENNFYHEFRFKTVFQINSERLLNEVSMLLTRINVYSKIKNNNLIILNEHEFFNKISIKICGFVDETNYKYNDVALDEIVEINLIDANKHKKMYDLTIPDTFNFGIANGLQVRDTSSTGYIQRQLIKSLEDLSIKYDLTNRNAKNMIVQYVYGDSGIDQASQTELQIRLISMNNKELEENFAFSQDQLSKFKNFDKKKQDLYMNQIKYYRDKLRVIQSVVNNDYRTLKEKYMVPVNLFRLTQDYSKNKVNNELDPQEILDGINDLINSSDLQLMCGLKENKHTNLIKDDRCYKFIFEIALHDYLSPKKCIFEYGLSKESFKSLLKDIKLNFIKAVIQPGEMVGIIAAQSIGEPTSQLSVMGNYQNKIIIKNKVTNEINMVSTKIGKFCDDLISEYPELTSETNHVNSVETNLKSLENEYYIIGVDHEEKTHWNKISHISRHPVNGQIIKVLTKSGRSVETTLSHSHLIRNNQTVEPIRGSDLQIGMRIPVAKYIDNTFINEYVKLDNNEYKLDYSFGEYYIKNINKLHDFVFTAPNEFKRGLINEYVNSNVNEDKSINSLYIEILSEQQGKDIALLLNYFDIFSIIENNYLIILPDDCVTYQKNIQKLDILNEIINYSNNNNEIDKIDGLTAVLKNCYQTLYFDSTNLVICHILTDIIENKSIKRKTLKKYIKIFESHPDSNKIQNELKILNQAVNSNVIWDEIVDIEIYDIDQNEYVYDFTVPANQTFMMDNGIIVHNTLNVKHTGGVASKSKTVMGVPRIQELLHYSKNIKTPEMIVYLNDDICTDKFKVNKISSYLTHLNIKDLIISAEIIYDIKSDVLINDSVSIPFFVNNQKAEINSLPFVFRLKMDMVKMHDKEITLLDIKSKFINYWTKNFTNLKNMKKIEKDIFTKISRCVILSNNTVDNQIIHIRFNMSSFNLNLLTEFLKIVLNQIMLKGIEHIEFSEMIQLKRLNFNKDSGDQEIVNQYIINTEGINFEKLKYIKGINHKISTCNDISTIYRLYGIEAAKQTIMDELNKTFNADGSSLINTAHISVLIDMMTFTGGIISIDRHGLSKIDSDPIAKASFEKTMEHFLNAAIFNEVDHVESVSSRIMLGRVIQGGTGAFDLILDVSKLENSEYTKNENGGRITFSGLEEESLFKDILKYGFTKMDFFLPI